jgi:hypothetical protein
VITVGRDRVWSVRGALRGAAEALLPAYGIGAVIGVVTGLPILSAAGAGAVIGVVLGAIRGLTG